MLLDWNVTNKVDLIQMSLTWFEGTLTLGGQGQTAPVLPPLSAALLLTLMVKANTFLVHLTHFCRYV